MIHMKLSTDETESGFTCKLHCMHVIVDRVVCVSGECRGWRSPKAVPPMPAGPLGHWAVAPCGRGAPPAPLVGRAPHAAAPHAAANRRAAKRPALSQAPNCTAIERILCVPYSVGALHQYPPLHTPILSPTIYYFDLYFMYRARTPGGKRFIC